MPKKFPTKDLVLHAHGEVPVSSAPVRHVTQGSAQAGRHRLPEDRPVALPRLRPVVSEPEEVPALRLVGAAVRRTLERHELRLFGVQDSHVHFIRHGLRPGYDMREVEAVRSISALQAALTAKAAAIPSGALITVVGGWSPVQLAENRFPTLAELDEAVPENKRC